MQIADRIPTLTRVGQGAGDPLCTAPTVADHTHWKLFNRRQTIIDNRV